MKTFKAFRNVNQVINEVKAVAFDVARVSGSNLPLNDSNIDADLLRKSTPAQRAAGITIFIREQGTQYANAYEVAEVRKAWGRLVVRTIEIKKEIGGLWVVALDCLTRYDNNGEALPRTAEQKRIEAEQAQSVANMAKSEAICMQTALYFKVAELAQEEADRLRVEAVRAEIADRLRAHQNENDDPNQGGDLIESRINFADAETTEDEQTESKGATFAAVKRSALVALAWVVNMFLPAVCVVVLVGLFYIHVTGGASFIVCDCWRNGSPFWGALTVLFLYLGPVAVLGFLVLLISEEIKYKEFVTNIFL